MAHLVNTDPRGRVDALLSFSPELVQGALKQYARQQGETAIDLLEGLLRLPASAGLWAAALEALAEVQTQRSADLAAQWAGDEGTEGVGATAGASRAGTTIRETRRAARRALWRLTQAGIRPLAAAEARHAAARRAAERVRRALMSASDFEGTRLFYLLIHPALGSPQMARVIASEGRGLLRFDALDTTGRRFERYVSLERPDKDFALAEVPGEYARWRVGQAAAASRDLGRPIPPDFLSFRDALEPPEEEPDSPIEAEPLAMEVRYRPEPADGSLELLDLPEFALWLPQEEDLSPLVEEWRSAVHGPLALPPGVLAQRRISILDRVAERILGPGGAAGARRRLADNALLLLRRGETRAARRALSAAAALDPDDPVAARNHPLLRALAERAIAGFAPAATPAAVAEVGDPLRPTAEEEAGGRRLPSGLILPR